MNLVLGNCENKLCGFFLGDSRPGAFVVADMCVNLLVELAFGAVLSPEMEVGCNLMRRDCSRCLTVEVGSVLWSSGAQVGVGWQMML